MSPHGGISALIVEPPESSLAPSTRGGYTKKLASVNQGTQALARHQICQCLDLGLPSLQSCETYISVVYKPPSIWYFHYRSLNGLSQVQSLVSMSGYSSTSWVFFTLPTGLRFLGLLIPRGVPSSPSTSPSCSASCWSSRGIPLC